MMQGSIETRIRARGRDAHGRMRSDLTVYDVRYRYIDPATGKIKQRRKRGFKKRADAEAFLVKVNSEQMNGIHIGPKAISFKDYLHDWLLNYAKLHVRESTYETFRRDLIQ